MLDAGRHARVTLSGAGTPTGPASVALAGRYTAIPPSYKWFRGSLVNLELGITLRYPTYREGLRAIFEATRSP